MSISTIQLGYSVIAQSSYASCLGSLEFAKRSACFCRDSLPEHHLLQAEDQEEPSAAGVEL